MKKYVNVYKQQNIGKYEKLIDNLGLEMNNRDQPLQDLVFRELVTEVLLNLLHNIPKMHLTLCVRQNHHPNR